MTFRLAGVYAHPDDDTHGNGGVVALHRDELEYLLIDATSGGAGPIADPSLATRETLTEVREGEQVAALEVLGIAEPNVHFLRYEDGRLPEVPREELVERIVEVLRAWRPHVVVTFGPEGVTRHPDHIAVGQATTEAFHRLRAEEATGRGFQRLLYNALPQSRLDRFYRTLRERGVDADPDAPFMPAGVPDHTVTIQVDCTPVFERKMEALSAHRTQAGEVEFVPEDQRREAFSTEWFVQAWPPVTDPRGPTLTGVFEGLET